MRHSIIVLFLLGLVSGAATRPARAQSLVDVAKQEEARRKAIKDSAKVYTNKDLPDVPPVVAPADSSTPAPADAAKTDADKAADSTDKSAATDATDTTKATGATEPVKDQKYWGDRMKSVQEQLSHDQLLADALQTRINALTTDFTNRDDPAQRSVIAQNRQKALDELTRLKEAVEADKKAIDNLEEEARRASVPPGWLR